MLAADVSRINFVRGDLERNLAGDFLPFFLPFFLLFLRRETGGLDRNLSRISLGKFLREGFESLERFFRVFSNQRGLKFPFVLFPSVSSRYSTPLYTTVLHNGRRGFFYGRRTRKCWKFISLEVGRRTRFEGVGLICGCKRV